MHGVGIAQAFVLTKTNAVLFGASIGAITTAVGTGFSLWISSRNERGRQRHALALAELASRDEVRKARHDSLRAAAAEFASLAVAEVELASALVKDRQRHELAEQLESMQARLRAQYQQLMLLSESAEAQRAARAVLTVAWNEKAEAIGLPRRRPRTEPDLGAAKELRRALRPFISAIRDELGVAGELAPEPED